MKKNLNSESLGQISGGSLHDNDLAGNLVYLGTVYIHNGCGGSIMNIGSLKKNCICSKCGESHFFLLSFNYTKQKR